MEQNYVEEGFLHVWTRDEIKYGWLQKTIIDYMITIGLKS